LKELQTSIIAEGYMMVRGRFTPWQLEAVLLKYLDEIS